MSTYTIPPLVASGTTTIATGAVVPLDGVIENVSLLAPQQIGHVERQTPIEPLSFLRVGTLDTLKEAILQSAIHVYQAAFSRAPYLESFSVEDVKGVFGDILGNEGDLVFGIKQERTISLTGGYPMGNGTYMIDELAVHPDEQGKGYGKSTLDALFAVAEARKPARLELRTNINNEKAQNLYKSKGFEVQYGVETVAQLRLGGKFGLDERVYLSRPPLPLEERLMHLKHIAIAYPSGNTTAVVFDKLLESDRKTLNKNIMDTWKNKQSGQAEIEQCCFVTVPQNPNATARVEMFGGEFCGNATRSAVWLITQGKDYEGLIEVSGVTRPLQFTVKEGEVTVEMPLPMEGKLTESVEDGVLVFLDGITHLVVTESPLPEPQKLFETLRKEDKYNCSSYPAFGVTTYDKATGAANFCVWVKAVDTVFPETACGSGTCSIGIALASESKLTTEYSVIQPSGESIRTLANYDGNKGSITKSHITGSVKVLYEGEFKLA